MAFYLKENSYKSTYTERLLIVPYDFISVTCTAGSSQVHPGQVELTGTPFHLARAITANLGSSTSQPCAGVKLQLSCSVRVKYNTLMLEG